MRFSPRLKHPATSERSHQIFENLVDDSGRGCDDQDVWIQGTNHAPGGALYYLASSFENSSR